MWNKVIVVRQRGRNKYQVLSHSGFVSSVHPLRLSKAMPVESAGIQSKNLMGKL